MSDEQPQTELERIVDGVLCRYPLLDGAADRLKKRYLGPEKRSSPAQTVGALVAELEGPAGRNSLDPERSGRSENESVVRRMLSRFPFKKASHDKLYKEWALELTGLAPNDELIQALSLDTQEKQDAYFASRIAEALVEKLGDHRFRKDQIPEPPLPSLARAVHAVLDDHRRDLTVDLEDLSIQWAAIGNRPTHEIRRLVAERLADPHNAALTGGRPIEKPDLGDEKFHPAPPTAVDEDDPIVRSLQSTGNYNQM